MARPFESAHDHNVHGHPSRSCQNWALASVPGVGPCSSAIIRPSYAAADAWFASAGAFRRWREVGARRDSRQPRGSSRRDCSSGKPITDVSYPCRSRSPLPSRRRWKPVGAEYSIEALTRTCTSPSNRFLTRGTTCGCRKGNPRPWAAVLRWRWNLAASAVP
jgi:hypothetical protein